MGDGSTLDEVVQKCNDLAPFFISQFSQESPSIFDWRNTTFYKWIIKNNPVSEAFSVIYAYMLT